MAPDTTVPLHFFRDEDPMDRYSFEVNRSISGPFYDVVGRDYILGQWASFRIDEEVLHSSPGFDGYHFALQQVARQLDRKRDDVVHVLYTATLKCLLDYSSRCKAWELLKLIGLQENLRGMSPFGPYDHYGVSAERDDAFHFIEENLDGLSCYEEFAMKIQLRGYKPFYTQEDFQIVTEAIRLIKQIYPF